MVNILIKNDISFVITEVDRYLYKDKFPLDKKDKLCEKDILYIIEISYRPKYTTKIKLLDMSFYYQWEKLLNVDMYELKKHLADNYGLHRKIGPSRIIYWDNKESVQKAMEYLESLIVVQKLCS